ncbi:MAG: hypothetical protein F6K53_37525, partial [Moorea sp. SIO4A1]|nr:hypothetical protein [Moorena sp. SIO4A1]
MTRWVERASCPLQSDGLFQPWPSEVEHEGKPKGGALRGGLFQPCYEGKNQGK